MFSENSGSVSTESPVTPQCLETLYGVLLQILFEKSLETGQPESIADTDDAADSSRPVHAAEKSDRALNFGHKIVEDRTHRLKDGFWIRSLRGVALQMLGLGKRQFHFTRQRG